MPSPSKGGEFVMKQMQLGYYAYIEDESQSDKVYKRLFDQMRHYMKHSKLRRKLRADRYTLIYEKIVSRSKGFPELVAVACKCTIIRNVRMKGKI
jgi:AmiR/NasT family two-component response regulator